jgi:hypothetical protein
VAQTLPQPNPNQINQENPKRINLKNRENDIYHQFERINYLFSAGSLEHMSKRVEHE